MHLGREPDAGKALFNFDAFGNVMFRQIVSPVFFVASVF